LIEDIKKTELYPNIWTGKLKIISQLARSIHKCIPRRVFTAEFKLEAVKAAHLQDATINNIAPATYAARFHLTVQQWAA
jgi:hypothetical protein